MTDFYVTDREFKLQTISSTNGICDFPVVSTQDEIKLDTASRRMTLQLAFNYDNTQNGLMEWILQVGIIGTSFLVLFLYVLFFRISKAKPSTAIIPILSFIYVLTIIAMIEISLDLFYFMAIGLLYGMALDEEKVEGKG